MFVGILHTIYVFIQILEILQIIGETIIFSIQLKYLNYTHTQY